jgi:hypothetical protein
MPEVIDAGEVLRTRLRARLGNPDTEEISDADLDCYLNDALDRMNRDRPASALTSFNTVADQEAYDVVPATAYDVRNVFWIGNKTTSTSAPYSVLEELEIARGMGVDMAAGQPIFDNPVMVAGYLKKLTAFYKSFNGVGRMFPEDGEIHLAPTPSVAGTVVWFEYSYARFATLAAVTKKVRPILIDLATAYALEAMAHQRSHVLTSTGPSGSFTLGGGTLQIRRAEQLFERYEQEYKNVPVGPMRTR